MPNVQLLSADWAPKCRMEFNLGPLQPQGQAGHVIRGVGLLIELLADTFPLRVAELLLTAAVHSEVVCAGTSQTVDSVTTLEPQEWLMPLGTDDREADSWCRRRHARQLGALVLCENRMRGYNRQ
jgi:hypothetical protein